MIEVECVSYWYSRRRKVLDDLSVSVDTFPLVVLGPNGAGKSTLLSLIAGAERPKKGAVRVDRRARNGRRAIRHLRERTGWLPQDVRSLPGFTCLDQVAYAGWLKGMSAQSAKKAAYNTLELVGLGSFKDRSAGQLSGGERRRLGIAQAIVHSPDYLILDEPHAGLDPEQRASVQEALVELSPSMNVVVSTHQTDSFQASYEQVMVMNGGQVLFNGSTSSFLASSSGPGGEARSAEDAYGAIIRSGRKGF